MAHVAQLAAEAAAPRLPPAPARLNVGPAPEMTHREKLTAQALASIRAGEEPDQVTAPAGTGAAAAAPARARPAPQPQAPPAPPPPASAGRSSGFRPAVDQLLARGAQDPALVAGAAGGCVLFLVLAKLLFGGGSRPDGAKGAPRRSGGDAAPGLAPRRGSEVAHHVLRNPFGDASTLGGSAFEDDLGDGAPHADESWDLELEGDGRGEHHHGGTAPGLPPGWGGAPAAGGAGSWGHAGQGGPAPWHHGAHSHGPQPGHDGMPSSPRMSSAEVLQGALGRVVCSGPLVARAQASTLWKTGFFILSESGHLLRYADPKLSPAAAVVAPCVGSLPVVGGRIAPFDGPASFAIGNLPGGSTSGALLFVAPSEVHARRWIAALSSAGCTYTGEFTLPAAAGAQAVCLDDGLTEREAVDAHLHAKRTSIILSHAAALQLTSGAHSEDGEDRDSHGSAQLALALTHHTGDGQDGLDEDEGSASSSAVVGASSPWAWPKAPGVAGTRLAELRATADGGLDHERQHAAIRAAAAAVKATVEVVSAAQGATPDDAPLLLTDGAHGSSSSALDTYNAAGSLGSPFAAGSSSGAGAFSPTPLAPGVATTAPSPASLEQVMVELGAVRQQCASTDAELARLRALLAETQAKAAADKAAADKAAADAAALADAVTAKLSVALDLLREEQRAGEEMSAQIHTARKAVEAAEGAIGEEDDSAPVRRVSQALAEAKTALTPQSSPAQSPGRRSRTEGMSGTALVL